MLTLLYNTSNYENNKLTKNDTNMFEIELRLDSLYEALNNNSVIHLSFVTPFDTAMLAAFVKKNHLSKELIAPNDNVASYLNTVDFYNLVWNEPRTNRQRSAGRSYCPLIELSSPEQTDTATTIIGNILERRCGDDAYSVTDVIGELIDNVWSHGKALGYAVAQVSGNEICFAVVDIGKGFKNVLQEANIGGIHSDIDAINWSIQKGHTSKGQEDEWAQSLPFDSYDNPFSSGVPIKEEENHHEGLGLYKLVDLVQKTKGNLSILSGKGLKFIDADGDFDTELKNHWQGVVIYCTLNIQNIKNALQESAGSDIDAILKEILG